MLFFLAGTGVSGSDGCPALHPRLHSSEGGLGGSGVYRQSEYCQKIRAQQLNSASVECWNLNYFLKKWIFPAQYCDFVWFYNDPIVVIPIKHVTSFQRWVGLVPSDKEHSLRSGKAVAEKTRLPCEISCHHSPPDHVKVPTTHAAKTHISLPFLFPYSRKSQELTTFIFPKNGKFSFGFPSWFIPGHGI